MLRLLRLLFWSAALFAFVMAALPHPPQVPGAPSDKLMHVLAFACLGLLGSLAYPRQSVLRLVAGLSAFGALIEWVQLIPSLHRDAELLDWVADTVAAAASVIAVYVWRRIGVHPEACFGWNACKAAVCSKSSGLDDDNGPAPG